VRYSGLLVAPWWVGRDSDPPRFLALPARGSPSPAQLPPSHATVTVGGACLPVLDLLRGRFVLLDQGGKCRYTLKIVLVVRPGHVVPAAPPVAPAGLQPAPRFGPRGEPRRLLTCENRGSSSSPLVAPLSRSWRCSYGRQLRPRPGCRRPRTFVELGPGAFFKAALLFFRVLLRSRLGQRYLGCSGCNLGFPAPVGSRETCCC